MSTAWANGVYLLSASLILMISMSSQKAALELRDAEMDHLRRKGDDEQAYALGASPLPGQNWRFAAFFAIGIIVAFVIDSLADSAFLYNPPIQPSNPILTPSVIRA